MVEHPTSRSMPLLPCQYVLIIHKYFMLNRRAMISSTLWRSVLVLLSWSAVSGLKHMLWDYVWCFLAFFLRVGRSLSPCGVVFLFHAVSYPAFPQLWCLLQSNRELIPLRPLAQRIGLTAQHCKSSQLSTPQNLQAHLMLQVLAGAGCQILILVGSNCWNLIQFQIMVQLGTFTAALP